ncbi:MAG: hypothetical protein PUE13_00655 [Clostridiales bacterium]|nr:hypothetical protein [Clostridiales bacterium]
MADMMGTLKTLLGDNADEKIQSAMQMLRSSGLIQQTPATQAAPAQNMAEAINNDIKTESPQPTVNQTNSNASAVQTPQANGIQNVLTPEGVQFLGQIRNMVDQISNTNDSRSNLLRSLRPFMRADRQQTIDRAIRIMNIGRFSGLFGK